MTRGTEADRIAYEAGWKASMRTQDCNLDLAEERFERRHGKDFGGTNFAGGWVDVAAGNPKWTGLIPSVEEVVVTKDIEIDTEVGPLVASIGEELLFQYPEGDADRVILLAVEPVTAPGQAEVRLPDGRTRLVDPAFLGSLRPLGAEASPDGSYHCPCGWSRVILDDETLVDARRAHEATAIHMLALRGEA